MDASATADVTRLLRAWRNGDDGALPQLMPMVYRELRQIARHRMALERPDHPLQPTALVNEAYLRLVQLQEVSWHDRAHFFAVCAKIMRHILVDSARSRRYLKRGGEAVHVSFDQALSVPWEQPAEWVALDDALTALAALDSRKEQVVELRFFAGMSVEETARGLGVSPETVMRDWRFAKVWILRELTE